MTKTLLLILLAIFPNLIIGQYTDVINSNKPGESFSAFSVGTNVIQVETSTNFLKQKHKLLNNKFIGHSIDFSLRYGFLKEELEFISFGNYQTDIFYDYRYNPTNELARKNIKEFKIGFKYLVYDPYKNYDDSPNVYSYRANQKFKWRSLLPALAVMSGVNIDSKMNPYTANGINGISPYILIATQNNFKNNTVFVANILYDRIGSNQSDFEYIFTLTKALNVNWAIFLETQGIKSDFYADNLFSFGAAYLFDKNFQIDASYTTNNKETPRVGKISFGLSYRFDFHKDKVLIK
ncbi:MAG: transporter [Flavobacteriales bacterium]|nr:MAG: transporter [Flavobacteriales bacterium]